MSRMTLFTLGLVAAAVCVIIMILYWTGSAGLGHHADGPMGLKNFKHGVLFLILAVVALLFAVVNRPMSGRA